MSEWRAGDFCKGDDGFPARYLKHGLCLRAFKDKCGRRSFSIKEAVEGDVWFPRDGILATASEVAATLALFEHLEEFVDKALDILGGQNAKLRRPPEDWERF